MPDTSLTSKKAKRARADADAQAELQNWKLINKARDKERKTNSPAPALPKLSARAQKIKRGRQRNVPIAGLKTKGEIERAHAFADEKRQQSNDSGKTSGCNGMSSPSSSAPTSLAAQPVIAQRLRGSPHLMTTEQNRILSTTDKYMKQKNDERAEAQTARLRETAMLAMSSCGIASDFVQVREQEILGQQEIVRKRCEKEGLGFYARVTLFSVQAAKSLYPEMDLTPVSISSPSFVAKVNNSILEGKISIEDCSDSSYLGGAEHLRWAVVNASPVLKVCSVLVLVLVLVLVCSKTCTCILTHIHT